MNKIVIIIVLLSWISSSFSARILAFFPAPSKSHLIVDMIIVRSLINKGHDLTVVTNMPLNEPNLHFKHIQLNTSQVFDEVMINLSTDSSDNNFFRMLKNTFNLIPAILHLCDETLKDPKVKMLKEESTFDLIILDYFLNDFQLGLAAHFNCPIVVIWNSKPLSLFDKLVGNPTEHSYAPLYTLNEKYPLSFSGRVIGFVRLIFGIICDEILMKIQKAYYKIHFPPDRYPSLDTVRRNVSLALINHHFSQGPIRPNIPAMVEIGGIQIQEKRKSLPLDIKHFLESAGEHGAIYFSFGSMVQTSKLSAEKMRVMFKVLASLKQKVLWKWESNDRPGNASNILFKDWFPQDDILAHSNVKLFITHGGNGGLTESLYHGVPMVAFPFFAHQIGVMQVMEADEFGLVMNFAELSEKSLRRTLLEVLGNPKYERNVKNFSKLYRDRPQTAKETALFWIEYVIRHRGASHMQSPGVHMSWWQILNLDILALLLVIALSILKLYIVLLKMSLRCILKIAALSKCINKSKRE